MTEQFQPTLEDIDNIDKFLDSMPTPAGECPDRETMLKEIQDQLVLEELPEIDILFFVSHSASLTTMRLWKSSAIFWNAR